MTHRLLQMNGEEYNFSEILQNETFGFTSTVAENWSDLIDWVLTELIDQYQRQQKNLDCEIKYDASLFWDTMSCSNNNKDKAFFERHPKAGNHQWQSIKLILNDLGILNFRNENYKVPKEGTEQFDVQTAAYCQFQQNFNYQQVNYTPGFLLKKQNLQIRDYYEKEIKLDQTASILDLISLWKRKIKLKPKNGKDRILDDDHFLRYLGNIVNLDKIYFRRCAMKRVHTAPVSFPSILRSNWYFASNPHATLMEIDIANAQFFFLSLLLVKDKLPSTKKFIKLCQDGELYKTIAIDYYGDDSNRDLVKRKLIAEFLFSERNWSKLSKWVAKEYPGVAEVVKQLKADRFQNCARTLQRGEASLMVDKIFLPLLKSGITTYTVHDSIIVQEQHAKDVAAFIKETCVDLYGVNPQLNFEVFLSRRQAKNNTIQTHIDNLISYGKGNPKVLDKFLRDLKDENSMIHELFVRNNAFI